MGTMHRLNDSKTSSPFVFPSATTNNVERKVPKYKFGPFQLEYSPDDAVFVGPHSPKSRKMDVCNLFDPYQVFEVEHKPCMILTVKVCCGRNITKGWSDLVDTPDPYVSLVIRTAPEGRKRTKEIDNEVNPVWNETFRFLLDESMDNIMEIILMEANYGWDEKIGTAYFNVKDLRRDVLQKKTFIFNGVSEVDLEMLIKTDTEPTLRYSLALCDHEKYYLSRRKEKVYENMRQLLGARGPQCLEEVPTVGVIGSGGGFRAMVGMSGVFKALHDSGVLQCSTYVCGLSGSSWYISTLYSHQDWPNMAPGDMQDELMNNIDSSLLWLLKPQSVYRYMDLIMRKRQNGQPVSFTDFFGHMVGETLLKDRLECRLTDQQEKLKDGDIPMPLLTCVHVKKDRSARSFQEWVEFSPYEIGMAKYGTFMPTKMFGNKFFMGKLCKEFEEPPLHFLQGIWGSAFCILFKRLLDDNRRVDPVEMIRQEMAKQLVENQEDESSDSSDDGDVDLGPDNPAPVGTTSNGKQKFSFEKQDIAAKQNGTAARARARLPRVSTRRTKRKGYWHTFLQGVFENKKFELLSTRAGRAGVIHNFMRGLSLQQSYPLSPFTPKDTGSIDSPSPDPRMDSDEFDGLFEMHPTTEKHLYMVDAGLTFNSPYPVVLRPQREVNLILSFDFSARPGDQSPPFKELLLAEKWAKIHKVAFPPIDTTVFDREGMKELYVFKHPTDPHCPIVLHFVLVNIEFRTHVKPGVTRKTEEEKEFADFDIFDDPTTPYSTFNFKYSHDAFKRLSQLTEFNTLLNLEQIKSAIAEAVERKRHHPVKVPCALNDIPRLRRVSLKNKKRLTRFVSRVQSGTYKPSDGRALDNSLDKDPIVEEKSIDIDAEDPQFGSKSRFGRERKEVIHKGRTHPPLSRSSAVEIKSLNLQNEIPRAGASDGPPVQVSMKMRDIPGRRKPRQPHKWDADMKCNSIDEGDDEQFYTAVTDS